VIDMSMFLGKIICIPDPVKAAERDEAFFSGKVPPPAPFPCLTDGILRRNGRGLVQAPAGLLSPHGTMRRGELTGRYDELIGVGFVLVSRNARAEAALGGSQKAFLDALGAQRVLVVADGGGTPPNSLVDLDRKFLPFMEQHDVDTMLVRPDYYLYGAVSDICEVNQLIDNLRSDLERNGYGMSRHRPARWWAPESDSGTAS
jgi:hypothetical protein